MMKQGSVKIVVAVLTVIAVVVFFVSGGQDVFTLANIKVVQGDIAALFAEHPVLIIAGFMAIYIVCTALSIPVATLLTLLAGSVFGFIPGLIIASFASTMGATLAFLLARFLFRDSLQTRYADNLTRINQGLEEEGGFFLFAMRLVPLFPFFMVNFLFGLTPIKTLTFFGVSQLGMLPGTAVYVYAGTELGQIDQLQDIASPSLLIAFALLGVFPIASKHFLRWLKQLRNKA
ncbi:TVP38/TMEM64 family inner membrane protein YdjZ [BD1-7 clade bacterium]|uniref:TVP38/TMEM64 family membrane protein n=1 Tax=BD1-7 clade bacterium TaxID=2029982 RepID=A0A5S9MQ93_9GAMM|nr:TVP38/TMEM64 family inner membrane protein YdjZ [BD1-7 clade bacterium]